MEIVAQEGVSGVCAPKGDYKWFKACMPGEKNNIYIEVQKVNNDEAQWML